METIYKFFGGSIYDDFDRAGFWTMLLTLTTIALCVIAWKQLNGIKKVSKADFINKFTDKFFNPNARLIMILLDYEALEFNVSDIDYGNDTPKKIFPFFEVKSDIVRQLVDVQELQEIKEVYSGFYIDDVLLGNFEDIGCFEKQGLIGIAGVYDGFDWYIQKVWENQEIKKYIKHEQGIEDD